MKKEFLLFLLLLLSVPLWATGPQKMPPLRGTSGPVVAVFCGGRPWAGDERSGYFAKAGCRVYNVNGIYLDGFSGSPIRVNMTDKVEPVPFDGITPLLEKDLQEVKLILFHDIPAKNMEKMLTPERIARLRRYVEQGGHLLFTLDCPNTIGDLLPLEMKAPEKVTAHLSADRPAGTAYECFPERIPVYRAYHPGKALPDAEVLSTIRDDAGHEVAPYLVRRKIGKGTVTFLNTEVTYATQLREFSNWAYSRAFFTTVAGNCFGYQVDPEKFIEKMQKIPPRTPLKKLKVSIQQPEIGITECMGTPVVQSNQPNTVFFGNGCSLTLQDNGEVSLTYPGVQEPLIRHYRIPEISYSTDRTLFDAATAEATDSAEQVTPADIRWKVSQFQVQKNQVVITYSAKNSRMLWIFTAGTMALDGREYIGIADRVEIPECPLYINKVAFTSELHAPSPLFARRNSCYSPPRGYKDFDMTGKTDGDTSFWSYFGSGQPFELVACQNGVFLANIDEAESVEARLIRKKGQPAIQRIRRHGFGRVLAPVSSKNYWHWFSKGPERGHNEYLAMYQLQRQSLRRKAGLKELPVYPSGRVTHQITADEQKAVREAAIKGGYRYFRIPGAEEPPDTSFSAQRFPLIREMRDRGMFTQIWSAGSYVQGDGGWIYNNHPEWFVRDKNGKIFCYGGTRYPVIDVNNEEFFQWYCQLAKPAIEAGIRSVYRDMDGAAANCINYAKKTSPHGMASQIRFYRFFHENDCHVAIEGMNPLAIDEYWYRPALYTPFAGNEFCLVGSQPAANFYEGLELDFFRTGMFGCFPITELSGYAFQFERVAEELTRANRMVSLVPKFNEALDLIGMPFVRETEFGTTWISEKGGALFFWNPAQKVVVDLPKGWKIKGVKGKVLKNVPADAIYLLEKK